MESNQLQKPHLLEQVRIACRKKYYSPRTEKTYVSWINQFILFHNKQHPKNMRRANVCF
ncbi:MAG: phage integrase N-terminal SAM-like domain-containing protein [Xanthomonadales bacterium]|nr:phage integrase N-terminal SAM-like domain-containing protein [Xanthomonadales bacterium]